jgi:hypothetical protein
MTMQEVLVTTLANAATEAGARIYPLTAPDNVVKPFVVYQRVASVSENVLEGSTTLVNTRIQIDAYALTYAGAQHLASQIAAALESWDAQVISLGAQDMYEDAVKLHRVQADYSVWHT